MRKQLTTGLFVFICLTLMERKTVSLATITERGYGRSGRNAEHGIHRQHQRHSRRCAAGAQHLAVLRYHEPGNRTHLRSTCAMPRKSPSDAKMKAPNNA